MLNKSSAQDSPDDAKEWNKSKVDAIRIHSLNKL